MVFQYPFRHDRGGGTIGAVLINYPMSDILGVTKIAKNVFFQKELGTDKAIRTLVEMSHRQARRVLGPGGQTGRDQ